MCDSKDKLSGTNRRRRVVTYMAVHPRRRLVGDSSATRRRLVGDSSATGFLPPEMCLSPLASQEPHHSHGTVCKNLKPVSMER